MASLYDVNAFGAAMAMIAGFIWFAVILALALYVYSALAFMTIAKKLGTPNGWLAFIPIANFYLVCKMAGKSGLFTLIFIGLIIPIVQFIANLGLLVISIWFYWIICEKLKKPNWWGILMVIPIVNLVILGILAWGK